MNDQGERLTGLGDGVGGGLKQGLSQFGQGDAGIAPVAPGGLGGGEGVIGVGQGAQAGGDLLQGLYMSQDQGLVPFLET